jgi:dolichyl-phosphate beta-glucosyltransferase
MTHEPYLSVVVPMYNEEEIAAATLRRISAFLRRLDRPSEILVVDDASTDGTMGECVRARAEDRAIRIIGNQSNRGKGAAVREGVRASRGKFVLCIDADSSYPVEQAVPYIEALEREGADGAVGNRRLEASRFTLSPKYFPYIFQRHCMGLVYNILVRAIAGIRQRDTQCGFKCFRGDVARLLFTKSLCDRFAFDVEILFLAKKRGCRIIEMPIQYLYAAQKSSVSLIRDSIHMSWDLLRIRRNDRRGLYD